ncbi:uncharacterized protein LOC119744508 [Patiria miniata]|uniref:Reelin domain-containing protein n=1 Tax=Patiria miniata TaxID=46514 RepID=A0A914BJC5_PATMI|nr:uncharacterized protein LOC119744508 [Patiria miniata]
MNENFSDRAEHLIAITRMEAQLNFRRIISGSYYLCLMAALSVLVADNHTEALPAGARRAACRGLPAGLQSDTADEVVGVTAEGQIHTQRFELNSYTPGQHVIVSVLEDSPDKDAHSRPWVRQYALQTIGGVTGQTFGRFKALTDATKLHHCGTLTILRDENQGNNGVAFAWLPPHEGDVQPVTIIVAKV